MPKIKCKKKKIRGIITPKPIHLLKEGYISNKLYIEYCNENNEKIRDQFYYTIVKGKQNIKYKNQKFKRFSELVKKVKKYDMSIWNIIYNKAENGKTLSEIRKKLIADNPKKYKLRSIPKKKSEKFRLECSRQIIELYSKSIDIINLDTSNIF